MTTPAGRPEGRYGPPTRRRSRRRTIVVATALAGLVALVLGWLVWVAVGRQSPVTATDIGFVIPDDQHVQVTYEVVKKRELTAVCTLTALDAGKGTVGLATVRIGPATTEVTRHTDTVRTSAMAVTGFVKGCEPATSP